MIRRPPRSTRKESSAASDVYKRQEYGMMIKELVKRIVLGKRYSSETFTKYLRSRGVRIGEDVTFFVPSKITVDEIYPWMISIGNHVRITEGCKILSHDFAWSVPKTMGGGSARSFRTSGNW